MTRMHENIAHVANILKEDCRSSGRLIAEWTGIPKNIVQQILRKDLQKWKLCMRFVPWAAHSQDFGEFDFIDLLSIFNSKNHPLGVAAC